MNRIFGKYLMSAVLILLISFVIWSTFNHGKLSIVYSNLSGWPYTQHHIRNEILEPRLDISKRFEDRLRNLRQNCKKLNGPYFSDDLNKTPFGFYTVPKKRLLMCEVPKAGTSTWINFFWTVQRSLGGVKDVPYDHKYLRTYRGSGLAYVKSKKLVVEDEPKYDGYFERENNDMYHAALMARHPFGRMISGWNDKFAIDNQQNSFFMNSKGIKNYIQETPNTNHSISWPDFARYIVEQGPEFNIHFKPIYKICLTCRFNYNYVVKLETLDQDKMWLLEKWNLTNFTIGREHSTNLTDASKMINYYMKMLPQDVVHKLYKIFEPDFLLFGYTFDTNTMEAGGYQ